MSPARDPGAARAAVKAPGAAGAAVKATDCFVAIFADESCIGNGREGDNPGGAGALIELLHSSSGTLVRRDLWISEPATTNNRMALRSVIESMNALGAKGSIAGSSTSMRITGILRPTVTHSFRWVCSNTWASPITRNWAR